LHSVCRTSGNALSQHLLSVDFKPTQKFLITAHYHTFFKIYMTILRHFAASAVLRCLSCVLALMPMTDADDADADRCLADDDDR
jgi:hypothetical protein